MTLFRNSKFDLNEIIYHNTYAEIILYNKNNIEVARTKIDLEDVIRVTRIGWYLKSNGYVTSNKVGYLHRFIIKASKGITVDHINRCKLDNRSSNLRLATQTQQNINMGIRNDNKSGVRGVSWCNTKNKWHVRITVNKKRHHIGNFENLSEAIEARKNAELQYFQPIID